MRGIVSGNSPVWVVGTVRTEQQLTPLRMNDYALYAPS
jgi:hypothetical protein